MNSADQMATPAPYRIDLNPIPVSVHDTVNRRQRSSQKLSNNPSPFTHILCNLDNVSVIVCHAAIPFDNQINNLVIENR